MGNSVAVGSAGETSRFILYYAGQCPLCNRVVRWMSRHLRSRDEFDFRPLPEQQSTWVEQGLPAEWWEAPESVLIQDLKSGRWYRESDAALLAIKGLDHRYRLPVIMAFWIPKAFRDWIYRILRPATSLRPKSFSASN
jgi:predicted DCC family thiol-disulfide oxidoreductase YuxK